MRHPDIFSIAFLDDSDEPISALGQVNGVMEFGGEPNPFRNLEGEADQRFMDYVAQSSGEQHLRIASKKKSMMPTLDGWWLVAEGSDGRVKITSQRRIKSHS